MELKIRHKESVPEEESNGQAFTLLVGAGAGLHGEHTTKLACILIEHQTWVFLY